MLLVLLWLTAYPKLKENVKFQADGSEGKDFSFIQMNGTQSI